MGGVQRYTQAGSCGTPDGQSVHRSNEIRRGGVAGLQTSGGRTEKKASDGGWKTTSELVDVDAQRTDGQGREKYAGMNKLFEGIPPEFADVADNWHEKKWLEKPAEWNFWYWINNC